MTPTATSRLARPFIPSIKKNPAIPHWFPAQQLGAPRECSSRYIVEETRNHRRVAYATLWELRPHRCRFDLAVRPEWQGQGIATQLLSQVMSDAQASGATGLQARVRDDKPDALEFIQRRGFIESHRMAAYRLDFAQADVYDFQKAFARLRDQGFEITNLAAAREQDSHYLEKFHELYSVAREGWPDPDPDPSGPTPVPFERVKRWLDEMAQPEAFYIAKYAQRYVAFSSVFGIGTAVSGVPA